MRAFARLSALRRNIEQIANSLVEEPYVQEFHDILNRLESLGVDVSDFRIPPSRVNPRVTSTHMEGSKSYSEKRYVEKPFILTKLDAVLGYFEMITSEKPRKIGFSKQND